jgi:hypothetical protein
MIVDNKVGIEPEKSVTVTGSKFVPPATKGSRDLTIFAIGQSANAYGYGYAGGQKAILSVDNELNTFINLHRETGGAPNYSGNLNIDITTDRGDNFQNNVRIYTSTISGGTYNTDAARYAQGGIYNPVGNTNPANAYYAFEGATLDGSNAADSWGGYALGVTNLVNFTDTTKHLLTSDPANGIYQYIPDGMAVTHQGLSLITDLNQDWTSGTLVWLNQMFITSGTWNTAENDFIYDQYFLDCVTLPDAGRPAGTRCAFAPDGQTGYIVTLGDDGSVPFSVGALYPMVFKTTDGGQTWEDPIGVQIGGPDGIEEIVYDWLTDQQIIDFFVPPAPAREEILYTTAFDCDIVVDAGGNPHIGVVVGIGDGAYAIYGTGASNYIAVFDIFSFDGGQTWNAYMCGSLITFRGTFGDLVEDNRTNISRTEDGTKVFVSWLDTHFEGVVDNIQPDIFCRGIDVINHKLTEAPINVTEYTVGWLQAYFFVAPEYVFTEGDTYTIPFTYEEMTPADPTQPVTFWFIKDFSYTDADFVIVGVPEDMPSNNLTVSQNYPNPFNATSEVQVEVAESCNLNLGVFNLMGQKVYELNAGQVSAGQHTMTIDAKGLPSGTYFYTVKAGDNQMTKKMVIE